MFYRLFAAMALVLVGCSSAVFAADGGPGDDASRPAAPRPLVVGDLSGRTVTLSPEDVAKLHRSTVKERIPHSTTIVSYEGVLLGEKLVWLDSTTRSTQSQFGQKRFRPCYDGHLSLLQCL